MGSGRFDKYFGLYFARTSFINYLKGDSMKVVNSNKKFAVVTGDIVGSSRFKAARRKQLYGAMKQAASQVSEAFEDEFVLGVDIFRGDSWQCLLKSVPLCMHVGLYYRAAVKALMDNGKADSRLAIAVGKIDLYPKDRASEGDGDAYRLSGRLLENLKGGRRIAFSVCGKENSQETKMISVIAGFLDSIAQGWTARQAQAISGALKGLPQKEIADRWIPRSISQQAVAQHLDRARWRVLLDGLEFLEEVLG
jgi:hypothetical protein